MSDKQRSITDARHSRWRDGHISSTMGKQRLGYLIVALIWNALAHPMFWLNVLNQPGLDWGPLLLMSLFPVVGLGLAYAALVKWQQWRRFGNLDLVMDPFPGSPGGDVGGTIEIPIAYRAGKSVDVTLSCVNVRVSRGGKNNSRHEHVLWRERASVEVEPGLRGSRLRFRFAVPADQPATTDPSDNYVQWVVRLHRRLSGADLDQTFELPVLTMETPLQSRHIHKFSEQAGSGEVLPADNVVLQRTSEGLRLFYPASRTRGMGLIMLIFGAVFGIVPGFILTRFSDYAGDAFGMIFIAFGGFFTLVFGLVFVLMVSFWIYSLFNSLEVKLNAQGVRSTRRFFGFRFDRSLKRGDIEQLRYKINAQQGQGAKAVVHYLLEAVPVTGKPVRLGDGIKGNPLAKRLMKEVGDALGVDEWEEVTRGRGRRVQQQ